MAGKKTVDAAAEAARWYLELKERVNDTFLPLFFDENRFLVLRGGAGSGKSYAVADKILERVSSEPNHRYLVCRKTGKSLRQSCFKLLSGRAKKYYAWALREKNPINETDMSIRFRNGSEIIFSGLDDVEKLKSIYDITGVWIEEATEVREQDLNQLNLRLRANFDSYLQIVITFNPVSVTHWLKKRFFDRKNGNTTIHNSTYRDNRFLTQDYVDQLLELKEVDPYYYAVYAENRWGVTGQTVFPAEILARRIAEVTGPMERAEISFVPDPDGIRVKSWEMIPKRDGELWIYKKPETGRPYVIGADTAGDGSDWFVAQVIDNITGVQVAMLRQHYDEDVFAKAIWCLGHWYNQALIAPEVNFSTAVTLFLEKMGYPNLYIREVMDTYTGQTRQAYGFRTDKLTRPVIIANLVRVVREHPEAVADMTTLEEMVTFVRDESFRPQAEDGAHDDTVLALAIAHQARSQGRTWIEAERREETGRTWTEDMWQDYRNAGAKEREALLKLWGDPVR